MLAIDAPDEQGVGTGGVSELFRDSARYKISKDKTMNFPKHYRILYAEDNQDSRELVSMMCRLSDIEVVTSETVAEAWEMAQLKQFDLYLLDLRFSDGDGLELCRRLRLLAPHTPILIYSGNAFEADKINGFAAGASGYLTKPYLGDLTVTIRQHIEQTKSAARQTETIYS
jgi:DNA-binding response OmpR family regulator